ncbi:MAG: SGNH/GDSL hydrolase family protein, partial [Planctomycetota bacterium]
PDVDLVSHGTRVVTNAHGLRGPTWEEVRDSGSECVLFLGHSIAFGFGVTSEEAYPARFAEYEKRGRIGINLGHCGYRFDQEFALAHRHLQEIRPRALVVMFTPNDLAERYDIFAERFGDEEGGRFERPKRWLRRHSVLYAYLRKSWTRAKIALGREEPYAAPPEENLDAQSEESLQRFDEYEEALRELQEAADCPLVLSVFPLRVSEACIVRLRRMATRLGAEWAGFEEVWESDEVYAREASLGWDTHPSAATHDFFARELAAAVERALSEQ